MAKRIEYHREPCSRCGGSGRYSWNAMHGDVCYGCSGVGTQLSARGRRAHEAVSAWKAEHLSRRVTDLEVGDKAVTASGDWVKILESATPDPLNEGLVTIQVEYLRGTGWHAAGSTVGHGTYPDAVWQLIPLGDVFVEMARFAARLDGTKVYDTADQPT